jgi:predicted 2-oxoglutarate/Fe(II)-dependent dioxygenase YbiX
MAGAPLERLLPGDRVPDVRLHGSDGGRTLHAEFAGAPLWLLKPSSATVAASLPEVPKGITALCVGAQAFPGTAAGWLSLGADARWLELFEDDVLWLADANLRLQQEQRLPSSHAPLPARVVEALGADCTLHAAPVLQIPDVFERDLCRELIRHFEVDCAGGEVSRVLVMEGGAQTLQLDPSIKQRRESTPRDPALEARMHERVMRRALPEIARVFNFPVNRRDSFKLLSYPAGAGYFRAHRDNDTPDVAHRRFALSVNLNHGDYAGGEFRYPEFGPHRYSPATGTALVFSCGLLHEVLPVDRGVRYAVTTFLS